MDDLFYAYGSDEACGENAYLFLNKADLKAIGKLVNGQSVEDVAALLEGNTCGRRSTSCADQLVHALREARQAQ